jgi:chemotaxis protein CheD
LSDLRSRYIAQGEQAIGSKSGEVISTVLGSCVSVCLWDPDARIGGMNHMLLPDAATDTLNQSAGAVDMELLINAMVRIGASRSSLRAKVFGGASMLSGITDKVDDTAHEVRRMGKGCCSRPAADLAH